MRLFERNLQRASKVKLIHKGTQHILKLIDRKMQKEKTEYEPQTATHKYTSGKRIYLGTKDWHQICTKVVNYKWIYFCTEQLFPKCFEEKSAKLVRRQVKHSVRVLLQRIWKIDSLKIRLLIHIKLYEKRLLKGVDEMLITAYYKKIMTQYINTGPVKCGKK